MATEQVDTCQNQEVKDEDDECSVEMLDAVDLADSLEDVEGGEEAKTAEEDAEDGNEEQTEDVKEATGNEEDEFAYLNRKDFTSEIHKIEVRNLGYFGIAAFRVLIKQKLELDMTKIKSPYKRDFAFLCFRTEEDKKRAIDKLNGFRWKGRILQAFPARPTPDPLVKRRKKNKRALAANETVEAKKSRTSAEAVCPLASMPYEEQLEHKLKEMQGILKSFSDKLSHINRNYKKMYAVDFKLRRIEPSPQINGYRNKNEFTVGKNAAGEIIVGCRLGSYADGSVEVSAIDGLPHLPEEAVWAAKSYQQFVRQSKLKPFNPEDNSGHFRQLMVRTSSHTGEIMLVPGIFTSNLAEDELAELKNELKKYYEKCVDPENDFKCASLYIQDVKHRSAGQQVSPVEHLLGSTHITDVIHDLKFVISPLSFFQVNTPCANVLYQKIIDFAAPQSHSTVLDICCGTGTIGLAVSKHCKSVVGVDNVKQAIDDAKINATANKIDNCKFIAGNADEYIESMVREIVYGNAPGEPLDIIAVVDPPRSGLHNRSITALRKCKDIKRLVYVSCDPNHAMRNLLELGRPESKHYKGDAFVPIKAIAVDMFPHAAHTEVVILFEREEKEED